MQLQYFIRTMLLVIAIGATGCASVPSDYHKLADTAQVHEYQQTSTVDILKAYGKPFEMQNREDGHLHFIYEVKEENVSHWTDYIPVKILFFGFDTVEKTIRVVFSFDDNQKLVETTVNEETIYNDYGFGNRRFYPSNMWKES